MEEIEDSFLYSPYIAAIADKDDAGQKEFFDRFYSLPQPLKDFLASPHTTARIQTLFTDGTVPEGYELAIAKIVMFIALGDVTADKIPGLLVKLGITPEQANTVSQALAPLIQDLEKARTTTPAPLPTVQPEPTPMVQMPPLTRPTETGPKPIAAKPLSPQPPSRNIIDLRQK